METENDDKIRRVRSLRTRPVRSSSESLQRVRSFKTTSKGLVNRGDSLKLNISGVHDSPGIKKKTTDKESCTKDTCQDNVEHFDTQNVVSENESCFQCYYRVLITGAEGVGKSSIIDQFMTSEFLGNASFNISQSEGERTVTLQVDGEESTLEFVQSEDFQDQDESFQIDGFVVVYCITERATFDIAIDLLKQIRDEVGSNKAIILVGNKSDLVRKRTISQEEGRSAADAYGCKYIELSAALNHRVDELLVGIHKQIKLKSDAENEELECKIPKGKERKSSFKRTKRFLEKVFLGHSGKDKKTENLYVD
ncbi:ras-related protein Ral-B-like isoform X6 [Ruditapes philippinarum]|uniref:ras-related protein Ral-B-like isoform X6 n=1 Tax=Ruditapes philippinarum TaxID=129788 RepID=UPI00295B40EF|nr:ras-related protein Ral-B-like isoform X6 [Ruditapes philippinarum]